MAAITVTSRNEAAGIGNKTVVTAKCASIANADTWVTGLGKVDHLFVGGLAATQAIAYTESGGTLTLTVTDGPATNVDLMAVGEP